MYTEKSMFPGQPIEIALKISASHEAGLFSVSVNGDRIDLPMNGEEVDNLTVGEILRTLYDKSYGAENPRFNTSGESPLYRPENPVTIEAQSYVTLLGYGQVRARDALIIWPDGMLAAEGGGDD